MRRFKTYSISALVALFLVVVIQNTASTEIRFLGWKISMSRALLFPIILLTGFCIGYLAAKWSKKKI